MTGASEDQALTYAAAGWPVFPTRPNREHRPEPGRCPCKAPVTRNGFKDATTDPAVIRAWWARFADLNVAIATGAPGPDVLDVDVHQDGVGWPAFNRLKRAAMLAGARALVRTPSGGLHVHFAGTGQDCGRLPRHHLDFKAAGGYVLAPPSVVHGKPYELLDHRAATARLDWQAVRRLLDPPAAAPALRRPGGSPAALVAWVVEREVRSPKKLPGALREPGVQVPPRTHMTSS